MAREERRWLAGEAKKAISGSQSEEPVAKPAAGSNQLMKGSVTAIIGKSRAAKNTVSAKSSEEWRSSM